MAVEVTNRQVNIFIDTGNAAAALDVLKKKELELKNALSQATDPRVVAKLTSELKKLEQPIDNATKKLKGQLSPTIKDLSKTVQGLDRDLKNLSKEDPNFNKKINQLRLAKLELEAAQQQALAFNNSLNSSAKGSGIFGKISGGASSLLGGLAQGFGIGLGVTAIQQIPALLQDSVDEFLQAEDAAARLENKLKNLGRSDVYDRITTKAQDMADKFKFLDNDDVTGVFNKLITYGKLTENQMDQLLPVIINFASDSRISLEESTGVIIKALEGNGKALKEYGINIKDSGNETERFKTVIEDLGAKVEGAADSFGNSLPGKLAKTKQAFADFKENVGSLIAPALDFLINRGNEAIYTFKVFGESLRRGISPETLGNQKKDIEDINRIPILSDKQIEKIKKLNKEQLDRLVEATKKRLSDTQETLRQAQEGNNAELELLAERNVILARRRLDAILKLATGDKVLGTGSTSNTKTEDKGRIDDIKRLKEELIDLEKQYDLKKLTAFSQKIAEINDRFDKIVKHAKDLNQGNLVDKANELRQRQIEDATNTLIESGVRNIPGLADLSTPAFSSPFSKGIESLIAGKKPGSAIPGVKDPTVKDKLKEYLDYAQNVISVYSSINASINSLQQQELDNIRASNDKKKESYQQLLEGNLISRKEYDKKVAILDKQLADRERKIRIDQFKRNKLESLSNAAMNVAEAATKAFTKGPIVGQILAGVVAALGAIQIGIIASQQPPKFGKGGKLKGPSHGEGGMPVIDPRTGRKQAEVEGGEVILSRNTVENNPELVSELLHSSMNRNGARIGFIYGSHRRLPSINFGNASRSISRVNHYANGGIFQQNATDTSNIEQTLENMNIVINELTKRLNNGIVAVASVQQFNEQNKRLADLISDVTMK